LAGKLRGLEFRPLLFTFEKGSASDIIDAKGRQVLMPTRRPLSLSAAAMRTAAEKQIRKATLTKAAKIAMKALDRAIDDLPDDPVAVRIDDWRQWAYRLNISTSDEPRAKQQAFRRATEDLNASGEVSFLEF
jgi:hypothetical protein